MNLLNPKSLSFAVIASLCSASLALADTGQIIVVNVNINLGQLPPGFLIGQDNPGGPIIDAPLQLGEEDPFLDDQGGFDPFGEDDSIFIPKASYFEEPQQNAVIAYNGESEILTLTTHQKSVVGSRFVLSVMPLPGGNVSVVKGDNTLFERARALVKSKLPPLQERVSAPVVVDVQIGPKRIFVIQAKSIQGFVKEAQNAVTARTKGLGRVVLGDRTVAAINQYLRQGFRYFAFDLTRTDVELAEKIAVEYKFDSPKGVYYPMVISQSGGTGWTNVELVVITSKKAAQWVGVKEDEVSPSVILTKDDLNGLDQKFVRFFGGKSANARIVRTSGEIDSFTKDIYAR